jgi:hypothetical protein
MHEGFQNAMVLVRELGKLDFFITMTCYIFWPEITSQLKEGEHPYDRPDLICRAFHENKSELVHDLWQKGINSEPMANVYTIEFQKMAIRMPLYYFGLRTSMELGRILMASFQKNYLLKAILYEKKYEPKWYTDHVAMQIQNVAVW